MTKRVAHYPRTIRLDDATWKAAGKAASLEGRTVSNWVAILIRREVDTVEATLPKQRVIGRSHRRCFKDKRNCGFATCPVPVA